MTFEEFQATAQWSEDLARRFPDDVWGDDETEGKPVKGYVYVGRLYIERVQEWWPGEARVAGDWYLRLNNLEWITDDRETLEQHLYEYAQGEEMA